VISIHIDVYAKCSSFGISRKANSNLILPYILGAREEGMGENLYSEDPVTYEEHSRHFDVAMAEIDQLPYRKEHFLIPVIVQTDSGTQQTSYEKVTEGSFLGH
jgi:hypothetical protein